MSVDPDRTIPLRDSSDLLNDPTALRGRAEADGVLFFRGLLDRTAVLGVRSQMAEIVRAHGWLSHEATNENLEADIANYDQSVAGDTPFDGGSGEVYAEIQCLERFHALAHQPGVLRMYESLLGGRVLPHPRNIARTQVPSQRNTATPPHQDFIHIQGATDTCTAWVPLGDCPEELGGLAVLVGSHKQGVLDYKAASAVGGFEAYVCGLDLEWMQGDYRAGDVITFHSQTVHKALANQTSSIRLSADFRYQAAESAINPESL